MSQRPRLRAVIFDVDGVLVQSMEKHHEAYQKAFAPLGIDVTQAEVFENEGRRSREVIESIGKARKLDLTKEQIDAMSRAKQDAFAAFGPMPTYPGVVELLDRIRERGLKIAIVTGTTRYNVEHHFGAATVRKLDAVVTADDVTRTKPDPEPYLAALRKLELRPEEAVVVENAPLGIRSAKAAGISVIAVTSTNPREVLSEADVVVPRVADVWTVLGGWM